MRIKDGYLLRKVAGNYIVIAVGDEAVDFNGMITVNETGAFLWERLSEERTREELISMLLEEYDVDEQTAQADVGEFIELLQDGGLIKE